MLLTEISVTFHLHSWKRTVVLQVVDAPWISKSAPLFQFPTLTDQLFNHINKIHSLRGETGAWKHWCMYRCIWKGKVTHSFLGLKTSNMSKSPYFLNLCKPRRVSQLCLYNSIDKHKIPKSTSTQNQPHCSTKHLILQECESLVAGSQCLLCYGIKFTSIHLNMKSVLCDWINEFLWLSTLNIYNQFFTRNYKGWEIICYFGIMTGQILRIMHQM